MSFPLFNVQKNKIRMFLIMGLILGFISLPGIAVGYQSEDSLSFDQTLTSFSGSTLDWGDYDNDGDLDLVISGTTPTGVKTSLYDNNGSGSFSLNETASDTLKDLRLGAVAWGDYDGDGYLDLVITGSIESGFNSQTYLFKNNGNGTFTTAATSDSLLGAVYSSIDWGDYDNDGDLDLFILGQSSSDFNGYSNLYVNNGDGTFTNSSASSTFEAVKYGDVKFADYDKDGDLDIVLAGESNSFNQVANIYQNNNDGTFTLNSTASSVLQGVKNGDLNWGDYNNDTFPDLVITGDTGGGFYLANVYSNNGLGSFTLNSVASDTLVGVNFSSAEWGDIDNDGDLDLAIMGTKNNPQEEISRIYLNNGDETFFTSSQIGEISSGDLGFADYDNDGDLDLLISGVTDEGDTTAFFSNNWLTSNSVPSFPSGLALAVSGDTLNFTWNAASDAESGSLSYNLFVLNTSNNTFLKSGASDTTSGFYRLSKQGNIGFGTSFSLVDSSLSDGSYRWGIQAVDGANKGGFISKLTFTINRNPPEAPQNIVANAGRNEVALSWNTNSESDLEKYIIYQETSSTSSPTNAIDSTTSTTYTSTNLLADSTYYYYITAKDVAGNESDPSTEVTAIPIPSVLSEHTDISATLVGDYYSNSEWGDYDNDGDLDLLIIGTLGSFLYKNLGNDEFESVSNPFILGVYTDFEWGDYDNDGDLDVIIANRDYTRLYRNNGNDSFSHVYNFYKAAYGSVTWGDFDNDGDLDILLSGGTSTSTSSAESSIYENNGNGSFTRNTTASNALLGAMYGTSKWADIDSDGYLDVVIAGRRSNSYYTRTYLNNGDKTFSYKQNIQSLWYADIELGDIDNDGDVDLALNGITTGSTSSRISRIYKNNGTGIFISDVSLTSSYDGDIELVDYDNDGDLDFTLSGRYTPTNIYENDGAGNWTLEISLPMYEYGSLAWGDYNSDGDVDLVITGRSNNEFKTTLYKNIPDLAGSAPTVPTNLSDSSASGKLFFSWDKATDPEGGPLSYNVFLTNLDDSKSFSSAMSDTSNGVRTVAKPGNMGVNQSFSVNYSQLTSGTYRWGVQTIDGSYKASEFAKGSTFSIDASRPYGLNYEAIPHFTTVSWAPVVETNTNFYSIYIETDSTVVPSQVAYTTTETSYVINGLSADSTYFIYITATDVSGDEGAFSERLIVNSIAGTFLEDTNQVLSEVIYGESKWIDFDNDGDLDLSINGYHVNAYIFKIYINDSGFSESNIISIPVESTTRTFSWGDYDNDGDQDIIFGGTSYVYTNMGNNQFVRDTSVPFVSSINGEVAWADYDSDGDLDLILTSSNGTDYTANLYENNGRVEFSLSSASSTIKGTYGGELAWGDVNNDGYLDLVTSGSIRDGSVVPATELYINNGNGDFTESMHSDTLIGVRSGMVTFGDVDNDGDLDLYVGGLDINSTSTSNLYINDGTGLFTTSATQLQGYYDGIAEWGDFDGDNDLDLLFGGIVNGTSRYENFLYKNDGSGNLSNTGTEFKGEVRGHASWGDYDNDGDLDLFIAGVNVQNQRSSTVYENIATQGSGATITPPTNLRTSIISDTLTLYWDRPTGFDEEVLTYNVYLINSDSVNADTLSSPMANSSSGFRKIAGSGNSGSNTFYELITSNLPEGRYYWGVQAINSRFNGGTFSSSSNFAFSNQVFSFKTDNVFGYKDTTYTFEESFISISEYFQDSTFTITANYEGDGNLFLDKNGNNFYDESDIVLKDSTLSYPFQSGDSLRYYASSLGLDSLTFYLGRSGVSTPDSNKIGIPIMQGTPEVSGNVAENGWYLLANPFATSVGELFSTIWTQGAINSDAPGGAPTLYIFNEETAEYTAITGDLDADTLDPGVGILVYIYEDDLPADAGTVEGGWPKTLTNFGNPFGDQVNIPIKTNDIDGSETTTGFEGLKLFGNPFGWPISVDSVINKLVEIDPLSNRYVYRWDPINKRYELSATGSIQPYESVFIRTVTSGLDDSITLDYDDYFEIVPAKKIEDQSFNFTLTHVEEQLQSQFRLKFSDEASTNIDPYDGYYLGSYAGTYANMYTQIGDQNLTINNLPSTLDKIVEFPIYMDATVSGEFDLEWKKELLPKGWDFSLEEVATGMVIDLNEQEAFSFSNGVKSKPKSSESEDHPEQKNTKSDKVVGAIVGSDKESLTLTTESLESVDQENTTALIQPSLMGVSKSSNAKAAGNEPVFILTINPLTSTGLENGLGIPTEVELHQNYPNPFNPTSVIRFGVPSTAKVQLEVFDILGRKVMTLVNNEIKQPGRYTAQFDARNMASGMYIYRLVIGDKILTKKMTLIK